MDAAWTNNNVEAVDELYALDARLILGWAPMSSIERPGIRETVSSTPNTYARVSPVTVTKGPVPGLGPLTEGSRYLHWVTQIHSEWFDIILVVATDGKIREHYVDEYREAAVRLRDGFPNFASRIATPAPS